MGSGLVVVKHYEVAKTLNEQLLQEFYKRTKQHYDSTEVGFVAVLDIDFEGKKAYVVATSYGRKFGEAYSRFNPFWVCVYVETDRMGDLSNARETDGCIHGGVTFPGGTMEWSDGVRLVGCDYHHACDEGTLPTYDSIVESLRGLYSIS